ncbi:hypothetical protein N1F89_20310 [Aquibium sp. A9E412]|uniref:hypothetical protein n=1 Tax=Aquibium sp. A9E412 TaxID=2976767 RepID=UPI0025B24B95|nr:hypothetical protein [Aquibium sp. A9E412]MDN2568574.1 hypothetical protein [Aquibium sp. A9E412]
MSAPAGLRAALARHGLVPRGGFAFAAGEPRPDGPDGRPAAALVLVGHAGGSLWPHFVRWRERQPALPADPLDASSRAVLAPIAARFGARAVYPFARPHAPFQRWAMRAEGLAAGPLGILMHDAYGPWHAYRGALLFADAMAIQEPRAPNHPCVACAGKPCLSACPVGAVSSEGLDVAACRAHVSSAAGAACRTGGCLARNACPVGARHRYPAAQQAFHMAAFLDG